MFDRRIFGQMRRSGMDVGLSKSKLARAMLEILEQLPRGAENLKDTVVSELGMLGYMSGDREINAAWTQTKKQAAKLYPEKFILDGRSVLHWNEGSAKAIAAIDKRISTANFKKLN
ncbi:hypothetical protein L0128_22690, partial [candidate division KSB1 bacterium]|nr:hypothetical protein [candidate division KSB1 bacterium]